MNSRIAKMSLLLVLAFLLSIGLCACAGNKTEATTPAAGEPVALKIALIPVLDSLPMRVAQAEGLFEKYGVKVEFVPVQSAPERDQVITAGGADGMINELLSTQFFNKDQVRLQVVRYARAATSDSALFSILAAGNSGIELPEELKGVKIAVSTGTIIEYLTDRLLEAQNFQPDEIKTVAVPSIPERMQLLASGQLKAAMLPEPQTSVAVQSGAKVVLDDASYPKYSFSTITFRKPVIDASPEAIRGFLKAIEDATALINADPQKYSALLVEQKILSPELAKTFVVPKFVTAGVPNQAQWDDMLAWAKAKGLLGQDLSYSDTVTDQFLP